MILFFLHKDTSKHNLVWTKGKLCFYLIIAMHMNTRTDTHTNARTQIHARMHTDNM